jgi:hypothetical protein
VRNRREGRRGLREEEQGKERGEWVEERAWGRRKDGRGEKRGEDSRDLREKRMGGERGGKKWRADRGETIENREEQGQGREKLGDSGKRKGVGERREKSERR